MALSLLKSGKQVLRLSSSAAAVAAKSQQQQLGGVTAAASNYLFKTKRSFFGVNPFRFSTIFKPPKQKDNEFANKFSSRPFQELMGKFMDLAEQSKHCPEDRLPRFLDDIRPVLKELLDQMSEETVVTLVYEFARPAASSPPAVIDRKLKAMVDLLPSHVTQLFIDMLIDMITATYHEGFPCVSFDLIEGTYIGESYRVNFDSDSKSFVLTGDVSGIGKEHLKLFVVQDYLMVTGTDKDAPPPTIAIDATIHKILKMPSCLYSRDKLAASIIEDQEQPGSRQLKIVVPKTEVLVENPRVFQLNLTGVKTYYEYSGKS